MSPQDSIFDLRCAELTLAFQWEDAESLPERNDATYLLDLVSDGQVSLRHVDCPNRRSGGILTIRQGLKELDDQRLRFVCSSCGISSGAFLGTREALEYDLWRSLYQGLRVSLLTDQRESPEARIDLLPPDQRLELSD